MSRHMSVILRPRTFSRALTVSRQFSHFPKDVGIVGMDVYFPKSFVHQTDLEVFDKVGKGKYTSGLEQERMAFVNDREDIYSISMTVLDSLVKKYGISYKDIGRLEVGTETVIDKSKAVKTALMPLFQKSGNFNVEGIDTINACYGGTSALFNALNWVESSSWDGRYAVVVCGDIAVYSPGAARPTGGVGAVAMLIGKDAPLVFERGLRGTYMENAYDFYKPYMESEYPEVDGHHSIVCYYRALDYCYNIFRKNFHKLQGEDFSLEKTDYALFHSPFWKMVKKSYARMLYLDFLQSPNHPKFQSINPSFHSMEIEKSYTDKDVTKVFGELSEVEFSKKTEKGSLLPKNLGNSYTASLYTSLLSLIANETTKLENKRVLMFSYGSGLAASMFSLHVKHAESIKSIADKADLFNRLQSRTRVSAEEYTKTMKLREETHHLAGYHPVSSIDTLFPGTYYLKAVDKVKKRSYLHKE